MIDYRIDQCGIDGKWRVFWLRPDGYGVEQLFDSQEAAQRWVNEMQFLERA